MLFLRGVRIDNLSGTDPCIRLFQTAVEHILYVDIETQTPFLEIEILVQTEVHLCKAGITLTVVAVVIQIRATGNIPGRNQFRLFQMESGNLVPTLGLTVEF